MAIEVGLPGTITISSALTDYETALQLTAEDAAKTGSPLNMESLLSSMPQDVGAIIADELSGDTLMALWVDVPQGHHERIARKWVQRCALDARRTFDCDIWFSTPDGFSTLTARAKFAAPRRLLVLIRAGDDETARNAATDLASEVEALSTAQFDSDGFLTSRGA